MVHIDKYCPRKRNDGANGSARSSNGGGLNNGKGNGGGNDGGQKGDNGSGSSAKGVTEHQTPRHKCESFGIIGRTIPQC